MRAIALLLLTCMALAGCASRVALAEPPTTTAPPERPDSRGYVFTDNPSIVDSRARPFDSWSRVGDDHVVAVHFSAGSPECFGVHANVRETADTVAVELRSGTLPEAVGRMCTMIAVFGTLDVPLQAPLGNRTVLSAY